MNRVVLLFGLTCAWLAAGRPAGAQTVQDPASRLGTPIVAIEIRVEGKPDASPGLASLVDIQIGDPLAPDAWRRVLQKFDQIPRFENVTVLLEDRPGGVALIFDLEPRHPISAISVEGNAGISAAELERQVRDRFNGLPAVNRRVEVENEVREILKNEGYRSATATVRVDKQHDPDRAVMAIAVDAGPLTTVASVDLRLRAELDRERTIERLGVTAGAPFRERALAAALGSIRDELRAKQFYTAIAALSQAVTFSDGGTKAHLAITIDAGPSVEIQVVPSNGLPGRLDELIPVKRLSAVDRDLLDESRKKIIEAWQAKGYRHATASYTKTQTPDRLLITYTVDRGRRYQIRGLEVPAGAHIPAAEYLQQPALKVGEVFDPARVTEALDSIRALYQQRGYYNARMAPEYAEVPGPDAQTGGIIIRPTVTEGPRGIVSSIKFTLSPNAVVTEADLRRHLTSREHEPFDLAKLLRDRDELNRYYESRGFLTRPTITPSFSPDGTDVTLNVLVVEGPQIFVGEIVVVGNQRIKTDVILRGLTVQTGSPYSNEARLASQRALSSTLGFRNVQITAEDRLPGENTTRLIVSVEESNPRTFDLGPGLEAGTHPKALEGGGTVDEIEFAPRAFVSAGQRNLWGRNRSIDGYGRVSFKQSNTVDATDSSLFGFTEYRVTGTYHDLDAFRSRTDFLVSASAEQATRTSYSFARKIASVDLSRPIRPRVTLLGRYSLETTRRFDEILEPNELPLIDRLFPQVRLSILSSAIVWDRRDNVLNPTRGTQMSANFDFAMRPLGSEVGFAKSFFEVSYFRPMTDRFTLATRGQFGFAQGEARAGTDAEGNPIEIRDLPASERFYSGGSYSVRGFQLDRLGVREVLTEDNLSTGGNGLIVLNLELRAHVGQLFKRNFGVVAFVDAGNVFKRAGDIDLRLCSGTIGLGLDAGRCLRTTAGFGFRYDSPFGPLRLDFGFKTDRMVFVKATERRWEFHLSFGEVF
ncbi:MAG TPA: BamA/TamA family outer membrane protein [Vicinamibacterales bacterium]|nr:BamA/TamA family outer membrane protein [Vicinamibacterales bacterium]